MPKQAKKTTDKKDPKDNEATKKVLHIVVVGLLVLGFGWLLLANPILNHLDKQRFLDAEEYLQSIYEKEIAPLATPDQVETVNSCRYTSTKLGDGTLFCAARIRAEYEKVDDRFIEVFTKNVERSLVDEVIPKTESNTQLSGTIKYDDLSCGLSIDTAGGEQNSNLKVELFMSCSGEARAEHFPLER